MAREPSSAARDAAHLIHPLTAPREIETTGAHVIVAGRRLVDHRRPRSPPDRRVRRCSGAWRSDTAARRSSRPCASRWRRSRYFTTFHGTVASARDRARREAVRDVPARVSPLARDVLLGRARRRTRRAEADPRVLEASRPEREVEGAVAHVLVSRRRHRDDERDRAPECTGSSTCRSPASCTCPARTRTAAGRATRSTAPGVSPRRSARRARGRGHDRGAIRRARAGRGRRDRAARGYLAALRELCRRHEILFVADEVITGFGRLGAGSRRLWDSSPDLDDDREGHHQRLPAARRHHW